MLLDEPLSALDAKIRAELRTELRRLQLDLGITSLLVTHDQEEAMSMSDRVVVMNQAKIEQAASPADVFHNPASEFVMDFLGNVNVFRGRIEGGQALLGDMTVAVPGAKGNTTGPANVYVRPHELEIERTQVSNASLKAHVARINPAGSSAKIALTCADGSEVQVDLPFERFRELNLQTGELVFVTARHARVFVPEYQI